MDDRWKFVGSVKRLKVKREDHQRDFRLVDKRPSVIWGYAVAVGRV